MKARKIKVAIIKEDLFELTGRSHIEAMVLGQFLYWQERVRDFDKFIEEERLRKLNEGEELNLELQNGWMFKSCEELVDECMFDVSKEKVRKCVNALVSKGFLEKRNDPNNKWNKKPQYRVNINFVIQSLKDLGFDGLSGYCSSTTQGGSPMTRSVASRAQDMESYIEINNRDYIEEENSITSNASSSDNDARNENKVDYSKLKEFFNSQMDEHNCIIPRINSITDGRKKAVAARARQYGKDAVMLVIQKASVSNFLNGGGDRSFTATFDWIFRPSNFPKILEGNYDNRDQNNYSAADRAKQERFRQYDGVIQQLMQEERDQQMRDEQPDEW